MLDQLRGPNEWCVRRLVVGGSASISNQLVGLPSDRQRASWGEQGSVHQPSRISLLIALPSYPGVTQEHWGMCCGGGPALGVVQYAGTGYHQGGLGST